ncbi:MAG: hypothetical protein ABFS03_07560 [Chloroflexota bacterium]
MLMNITRQGIDKPPNILYLRGMNPDNRFPPASITLIVGQRAFTRQRMHALIVALALENPVRLLIGGNRYDHYGINYAIAAVTPHYEHILDEHIYLSRAETCYQMVELLIQTPDAPTPTLVLDLLTTFYDESAPDREVNQLLFESILNLRRLSQQAPVLVSARSGQTRPHLLKALLNAADQVEYPALTPPEPRRQYSFIE